ncbi:MAG: 3-oxoacyl-[acyl-carrier-protein] reductase [Acidimicrobiia bacterium]|nr:3-oxoacyl-[acyl-carrier-protein] reductase [Acidimicrobiia bacterium]
MGRVALVTGAGRGIGRAVAEHLADAGHRVAVNYRSSAAEAEAVAAGIVAAGGEAVAVGADVSDEAAVAALFAAVEQRLGPVEILVNNAGITRDGLLLRMSAADWDAVLAADLRSAFLCTRAALRHMVRARWGRIVSIGSVAGLAGNAGQANYAAAKAGLIGFSKAVAREVGSRGITVNVVAPGFIETDMTAALGEPDREAARQAIALGRFGTPQEVAAAVGYLASGPAAYVTGQVMVIDGGMAL